MKKRIVPEVKSFKLHISLVLLAAFGLASSCCLIQELVFAVCPVAETCCGDESAPEPATQGEVCVMVLAKLTPKSVNEDVRETEPEQSPDWIILPEQSPAAGQSQSYAPPDSPTTGPQRHFMLRNAVPARSFIS